MSKCVKPKVIFFSRLSQAQDELKKHGPSLKETERNYRQERKECDGLIEAANKLQVTLLLLREKVNTCSYMKFGRWKFRG